jgi:uncharacterized protein
VMTGCELCGVDADDDCTMDCPSRWHVDDHPMSAYRIARVEVGSTAHGTGLPGLEDLDLTDIVIPPPLHTLGLPLQPRETWRHRPGRAEHEPSEPGDIDLVVHTLRKFAQLAARGNPSILLCLFAPTIDTSAAWAETQALAPMFVTAQTRQAFLGYMQAQRERIEGTRGAAGRIRRNPDGDGSVDWKYAMHMIRLGYQGIEFLTAGRITLPILEATRERLLAIRRGHVPLPEIITEAADLEGVLRDVTDLPPTIDYTRLSQFVADTYLDRWRSWR